MRENEIASLREVKSIAQTVLELERTVLRRAWGILYAVAAMELLAEGILPLAFYELGFRAWYDLQIYSAVGTAAGLLGLVTSVWILRRVYALRFIRRSISESIWVKVISRPLLALAIFALVYVGLIAALKFLTSDFYTILFGLEVATIPSGYCTLKVTFPEGLPREGLAVFVAYSISSIGIFVTYESVFATDILPYFAFWVGLCVVFVLAFVHSRSVKIPEAKEVTEGW
jgi:hypothetical protein